MLGMPPKAQAQHKQAQQQENSAPLDEREQMAYNDERRRAREFGHRAAGADRPDTPAGFGGSGLAAERHHHPVHQTPSGRGRLDTIRSDHSYHHGVEPSSRRVLHQQPQHASTSRGYASTPGASTSAHTPEWARGAGSAGGAWEVKGRNQSSGRARVGPRDAREGRGRTSSGQQSTEQSA